MRSGNKAVLDVARIIVQEMLENFDSFAKARGAVVEPEHRALAMRNFYREVREVQKIHHEEHMDEFFEMNRIIGKGMPKDMLKRYKSVILGLLMENKFNWSVPVELGGINPYELTTESGREHFYKTSRYKSVTA